MALLEGCGIMVDEEDIARTVMADMEDRVTVMEDMIFVTIQSRDVTDSYMSEELQMKTGKRISYLLRHGANKELVKITPQGYITITDIIQWLNKGRYGPPLTKRHVDRIVAMDEKSRFHLKNHVICAVNGHSMELPELAIPEYNETGRGHKRFLVHETYIKYLPSILRDGLSRMSRNNIHFSMETGRAD